MLDFPSEPRLSLLGIRFLEVFLFGLVGFNWTLISAWPWSSPGGSFDWRIALGWVVRGRNGLFLFMTFLPWSKFSSEEIFEWTLVIVPTLLTCNNDSTNFWEGTHTLSDFFWEFFPDPFRVTWYSLASILFRLVTELTVFLELQGSTFLILEWLELRRLF